MVDHASPEPALPSEPQDDDPPSRVFSVIEAAELYNFPVERLMRRLDAGAVPGAFKRNAGETDEWCIPENSLSALGYSPAPALSGPPESRAAPGAIAERASSGGDGPAGLGQLARDLRRQAAAELSELEAGRAELEAERVRLTAERAELEAAFGTLEEYRTALEADMAKFASVRDRVDQRAKALAADRRRLTAESKRVAAEEAQLAEQLEELEALRQQLEEERLELRRRAPAESQRAARERTPRRRRKAPERPTN